MKKIVLLAFLVLLPGIVSAQTVTVNWTNLHQIIDGFGASDAFTGGISSSNLAFFFGNESGELGLSMLRVAVTNGGSAAGNCTTSGASCAPTGAYLTDIQAAVANGAKIYASPWSPPAAYMSNGSVDCTARAGNGSLLASDYGAYATWLVNWLKSLSSDNIPVSSLSIQNEPNICQSYDSALWSASAMATFLTNNLGPAMASAGFGNVLLSMPEGSGHSVTGRLGGTCMTDASCYSYVGITSWHDYDATASATGTISSAPNPWPGKHYWETEASCGSAFGPSGCESGFATDMATDGLMWARLINDRLVNQNANAYLYWWLQPTENNDSEGLMANNGTIAKRAYVFGQYSKFVRPGFYRIDCPGNPHNAIYVSCFQGTATNELVVVAINVNAKAVSQSFLIENAGSLSWPLLRTWTTTATQSLAESSIAPSGNAWTYSLPAQSVVTFENTPSSNANACPASLSGTGITTCH
jgi:glucuronoarabinoxylan endo-1,4-beta-xylanase